MEESGQTIREAHGDPVPETPKSWLCDKDDQPVIEYIPAGAITEFRVKVGNVYYERFGTNAAGESLYRQVK